MDDVKNVPKSRKKLAEEWPAPSNKKPRCMNAFEKLDRLCHCGWDGCGLVRAIPQKQNKKP